MPSRFPPHAPEMRHQRVKSLVPRHNVKTRLRIHHALRPHLGRQHEIERILPLHLGPHQPHLRRMLHQLRHQIQWHLGLILPHHHDHHDRPSPDQLKLDRLNILKVHKYIMLHCLLRHDHPANPPGPP